MPMNAEITTDRTEDFSLFPAYAAAPFAQWLIRRRQLRKSTAIAVTLAGLCLVYALLKLGWLKAVVVAIGLTVINNVMDFGLQPVFLKRGFDISFLEVTLSLIFWGYLLGPWEPYSPFP